MESESAFIDKSNGKVYLLVKYNIPPLKIHESYTKGRRMGLDDFKFILDGIKSGVLYHNQQAFFESLQIQVSESLNVITEELDIYKTTGEFTKTELIRLNVNGVDRQKVIASLEDNISKLKYSRENLNSNLRDASLKIVPKVKDNLENVVATMTPELFSKLSLVQYDGIITLNGQLIPKTSYITGGFSNGLSADRFFLNHTILRRFLEFYMETYDFRSQGFGTTKTTTLEVNDLIIAMDSGMKIVTDLTCPKMITVKNNSSILNIGLDVTLKNTSFGVSVLGQEIVNVDIPLANDPLSSIDVKVLPEYTTVIRRKYWIDECMLILNIILYLILKNNTISESKLKNVISMFDERILIIIKEGIVLDHAKIQSFVEEVYRACSSPLPSNNTLTLITTVLGVILSGEKNEIKENFSVEVRRILNELILFENNQ